MLRANLLLCDDAFMLKLDRLEGDPMALPIYCHLMHDVLILLLKILAPKPRSQCLHLLEIEKLFTMLTALASCFTPARLTDNVSFLTLAYHQNTMNTVGRSFRGLHLPRRRSSLPLSARARLRHRIWLAFLLAHWHRAPFFAILVYFVKVHLHRKSSGSATWCRQPSDGLGRLGPVITKDKLRQIESFWNLAAGYCTSIFNAKEQNYLNRDTTPPPPGVMWGVEFTPAHMKRLLITLHSESKSSECLIRNQQTYPKKEKCAGISPTHLPFCWDSSSCIIAESGQWTLRLVELLHNCK